MRINKYLTTANYCSRREADRLIEKGKVKINDTVAQLGQQVGTSDRVFVRGFSSREHPSVIPSEAKRSRGIPRGWEEIVLDQKDKIYLAFHKPVGVICTTDPKAKDNIIEAVNYPERVYPVGRLDVASSGLILLTNDGSVVNKILKGQNKVEKEYLVDVDKLVTEDKLKRLERGVVLDGHKTLPAKTKKLGPKKFSIVIVEGKSRQVRRMCEMVGLKAVRLHRVRIGRMLLSNLKRGAYRKVAEFRL